MQDIWTEDIGASVAGDSNPVGRLKAVGGFTLQRVNLNGIAGALETSPKECLAIEGCYDVKVLDATFKGGRDQHIRIDKNCRDITIDEGCVAGWGAAELPGPPRIYIEPGAVNIINKTGIHRPRPLFDQPAPANRIISPNDLLGSGWSNGTSGGPTITANTTKGPDGSTLCDSVHFPGATTVYRRIAQTAVIAGTAGVEDIQQVSFWVKMVLLGTRLDYNPRFNFEVRRSDYPTQIIYARYFMVGGNQWMPGETEYFSNLELKQLGVLVGTLPPPVADISYFLHLSNVPSADEITVAYDQVRLGPLA